MAAEFDHILNECIDRLLRGESLEQCLQCYPGHAAQLEPLLRVAQTTHQTASAVEPRPEFKAQARHRISALVHDRKQKSRSKGLRVFGWMPRWATAVVIAAFVILAAGSGTVMAASGSLPGDTLYSVKLATERVQFTFAFSEEATANLHAKFAERRAEEMAHIGEAGKSDQLQGLTERFQGHLREIEKLAAKIKQAKEEDGKWLPALRQRLGQSAMRDVVVLEVAESRAPEPAKPFIARAKDKLSAAYRQALKALNSPTGQ